MVTFEPIMQHWCPSRFRIPRTIYTHSIYKKRQNVILLPLSIITIGAVIRNLMRCSGDIGRGRTVVHVVVIGPIVIAWALGFQQSYVLDSTLIFKNSQEPRRSEYDPKCMLYLCHCNPLPLKISGHSEHGYAEATAAVLYFLKTQPKPVADLHKLLKLSY